MFLTGYVILSNLFHSSKNKIQIDVFFWTLLESMKAILCAKNRYQIALRILIILFFI